MRSFVVTSTRAEWSFRPARACPAPRAGRSRDSVVYTFTNSSFRPTVVLSHRYISSAPGELAPDPVKQGGYNLLDARLSGNVGRFILTAHVENIADVRGVSQAASGVRGPVQFLVHPRTVGATLDYRL